MKRLSTWILMTIVLLLSSACSASSENNSSDEAFDRDKAVQEIENVIKEYDQKVFRDFDIDGALPLTCGVSKSVLYMYKDLNREDIVSDDAITIENVTVDGKPEELPIAYASLSSSGDHDGQSPAQWTLLREDGQWRICQQN